MEADKLILKRRDWTELPLQLEIHIALLNSSPIHEERAHNGLLYSAKIEKITDSQKIDGNGFPYLYCIEHTLYYSEHPKQPTYSL